MLIEKGVPVPQTSYGIQYWVDAIKLMDPGDSFLFPSISPANRAALWNAALRLGFKMKTKKENDKIRIWRID